MNSIKTTRILFKNVFFSVSAFLDLLFQINVKIVTIWSLRMYAHGRRNLLESFRDVTYCQKHWAKYVCSILLYNCIKRNVVIFTMQTDTARITSIKSGQYFNYLCD